MRKALFALILVVTVLFAVSRLRAEQAPWNSIYHSIKQLSVEFRRSSSAETDSTPARHTSKKKHRASPSPTKSGEEANQSATPTPKTSSAEGDKKKASDSQDSTDQAKKEAPQKKPGPPSVASLRPDDLREFNSQLPKNQQFIRSA